MNKEILAKEIFNTAYLQGDFVLRSGLVSNEYFDKYLFESNPQLLKAIASHMLPLIPKGVEVLAGLEMGGIPIATALSLESGLPLVMVRKVAKEYGTCKVAEGLDFKGKNVCIIEDVITTAGQVLLSTSDLASGGVIVNHVMCVIFRDEAGIILKFMKCYFSNADSSSQNTNRNVNNVRDTEPTKDYETRV